MTTYNVQIPVSGSIIVTVEADTPEAAKEIAWDKAGFRIVLDSPDEAEAGDFETHDKMCYGNVCCASCNALTVEEV